MARKFLTALDLAKNELQNAVVQNVASAPAAPVKGQIYFDSTGNILYWYNGSAWVPAMGGATSYGTITQEQSFGATKVDGVATTVARSDHAHGNPVHNAAAHSTIPISALAAATADVSMGGFKITNLGTPTFPADASTKGYVDNLIVGLSWKDSVRVASTGGVNINARPTTIDGVTMADNDRVLLKSQGDASSGIYYYVPGETFLARTSDADTGAEMLQATVFVEEGTVNGDTAWTCTTNAPITIGTTPLTWVQFAGGGAVSAGAGMTQSGNTLNVIAGDTSLTVAADDVRVNTSVIATVASLADYARKYVNSNVGGATSFPINHNLGYRAVAVHVYRNTTPYDMIECDVEHTSATSVTLRFAVAPAANEYTCVVVG